MKLSRDFKEFVASFNANGVRYLVVGGYAVAMHGHPRYTKDLDVWIEVSAENARRVIAALGDFGFGDLGLREQDFLELGSVVQLGQASAVTRRRSRSSRRASNSVRRSR